MSKAKFALTLLASVALQPSSLYAQDHSMHGSMSMHGTMVSSPEHKAQSPEITLGADGSVHMIWIDENTAAPSADHSKYGHSHVAATNLLYARSRDGGKTFTQPVPINEKPGDVWGFSVSKPRIVAGANGILHVFYPGNDINPTNGKPEAIALYTRSTDGGRSFAKAQRLNEMGKTDASDLVHGGLTHAHVFGTLAVDGKRAEDVCVGEAAMHQIAGVGLAHFIESLRFGEAAPTIGGARVKRDGFGLAVGRIDVVTRVEHVQDSVRAGDDARLADREAPDIARLFIDRHGLRERFAAITRTCVEQIGRGDVRVAVFRVVGRGRRRVLVDPDHVHAAVGTKRDFGTLRLVFRAADHGAVHGHTAVHGVVLGVQR